DPVTFDVGQPTSNASPVSGPQAYSGTITAAPPPGLPVADVIDLCNTVGADCWFSIPHAASDACLTALGQQFAAGLAAGRRVYLEYSNEVWNSGFPQFEHAYAMAQLDGTLPGTGYQRQQQWYARQTGHLQALFLAAWTGAGRAAGDVLRVVGSQF